MPSRNGVNTSAVFPFAILVLPLTAITLVNTTPQAEEKARHILYKCWEDLANY
ncbi:MAG: hypothetical protein OEY81_01420 [Candidatus Bathyarchaeota archaeon]|nr:hypothetical protein [Candidatus Bathyarchaeota archaeon]